MQVSKEAEEGQRPHNGVITAEDMDKSAEVDGEQCHDQIHHPRYPANTHHQSKQRP
jgi:hypothetical protein